MMATTKVRDRDLNAAQAESVPSRVTGIAGVGVIGAGTMGSGIAQLAAAAGYAVTWTDQTSERAEHGRKAVDRRLARMVERGHMTASDRDAALSRIQVGTDVALHANADAVIEAVYEDLDLKREIFQALDRVCKPDAMLATNTSSFSITEIAAKTGRPGQVVGMHFFNPAPVMKLCEVVCGYSTQQAVVDRAMDLARSLGRTPIEVRKDSPGFIVNRILMPLFIEACKVVEEGIATPEDVDTAIELGLNHPMGPFTLLDFTGLDVNEHVMDYFFDEFRQTQYGTPRLIRELVRAGRLGRKAGHGVYDYDPETGRRVPPSEPDPRSR